MGMETIVLGTGLAALAAGTGIKAFGEWQSGGQSRKAYEYNAGLDEYGAKVAAQQKDIARAAGEDTKYQLAEEYGQIKGLQRTGYSKAGVTFEGTPTQVMRDSAKAYEYDILKADYNTRLAEYNADAQSTYYGTSAQYKRWLGAEEEKSSRLKAVGTILQGGSMMLPYFGSFGSTAKAIPVARRVG